VNRPEPAPPFAPAEPVGLHSHAMANLRYIRDAMERAGSFTAVPGWGGVAMGVLALGAAAVASQARTAEEFLGTWTACAVLALLVGGWALVRKARTAGVRVSRGAGRQFLLGLSPPLVAAAVLTVVLHRAGATGVIPGMWLLLYGTAVITAGAFSVRAVPLLGMCFVAVGIAALFVPATWANGMMALGFGGLQIVFGVWIARRYGG